MGESPRHRASILPSRSAAYRRREPAVQAAHALLPDDLGRRGRRAEAAASVRARLQLRLDHLERASDGRCEGACKAAGEEVADALDGRARELDLGD